MNGGTIVPQSFASGTKQPDLSSQQYVIIDRKKIPISRGFSCAILGGSGNILQGGSAQQGGSVLQSGSAQQGGSVLHNGSVLQGAKLFSDKYSTSGISNVTTKSRVVGNIPAAQSTSTPVTLDSSDEENPEETPVDDGNASQVEHQDPKEAGKFYLFILI